jgi:hypothetical protein
MLLSEADTKVKFLLSFTIWQDGHEQIFKVMDGEEFMFIVNGARLETTLAKAMLLLSAVYKVLQHDSTVRTFVVSDESLHSSDFELLLAIVHCHCDDCEKLSQAGKLSFLPICHLLGNERLAYTLLALMSSDSNSITTSPSTSKPSESCASAKAESKDISVRDVTIGYYASRFYSYSPETLQHVDKETLHHYLKSSSLKIESEHDLLQTLIELVSDYFEFWDCLEVILLSDTGLSCFVMNLDFEDLTLCILGKLVSHLQGVSDNELHSRRLHFAADSTIFPYLPRIQDEIKGKAWTILYHGTEHGFGSSHFHKRCDGKANTITIILTMKGFVFGVFTPVACDSSGSCKSDSSWKSFLFGLKNPRNIEAKNFSF